MYHESKDIGKLRWGNTVVSTGWSHVMNHKMFSHISAYYTRYNSSIKRMEEIQTGKKGDDEYEKSKRNTSTQNGINDLGFRMNFDYLPAPAHHIRFGSNYIYHHFRPEYTQNDVTGDYSKLNVRDVKETLTAHELAVYAEDDWTVNRFMRLNAGLRFSLYNVAQKTYTSLEPRLSTRFLITPVYNNEYYAFQYFITFKDIPHTSNYYQLYVEGDIQYIDPVFSNTGSTLDGTLGFDGIDGRGGHVFTDELIDGKEYTIQVKRLYPAYAVDDSIEGSVNLYSLSESYYQYLLSLEKISASTLSGTLSDIGLAEPIRVYTNVNNGTGILGACQRFHISINLGDYLPEKEGK